MGLFSALMGNAGAVDKDSLVKDYGKLLITGEDGRIGFQINS